MPTQSAAFQQGRDAIARGAWEEARTHLERAVAEGEGPEALELLGLAGWWTDDAPLVFGSRERAYKLFLDAGDTRRAGRVAIWLVWDNLAFRGDHAVASGWLERARRLLADHPRTQEYGWLLIREGDFALFHGHDARAAVDFGRRAAALGRELGAPDVEFTALALEGLAEVSSGDVSGMRHLDEASVAATAGEVKALHAVGLVCCWQIFACERVHDFERAVQWCTRVQEFSKRWGLSPLYAVCRTQYAGVLIWNGDWAGAEAELTTAQKDLERVRPALVTGAVVRLADLRRRQGRFDEAMRLYDEASSHPAAMVGRAQAMLKLGNHSECVELATRYLEDLVPGEITARAAALEPLACARAAIDDLAGARSVLVELQQIAKTLGTTPLSASASLTEATILSHEDDVDGAIRLVERAIVDFERSNAPFETASARLLLADLHRRAGRTDAAQREAKKAAAAAESLGAAHELVRATELLDTLSAKKPANDSELTARQVEILRLVATGQSNPEIAKRLKLSQHTVKRHVANLLTRLDLPSRAAAAAYATKRGLI